MDPYTRRLLWAALIVIALGALFGAIIPLGIGDPATPAVTTTTVVVVSHGSA